MIDRALRAKILLTEAAALGLDLADLLAADTTSRQMLTVAEWIEEITLAFTLPTAATYRSYWRLTIAHLGDRHLTEVTVIDLELVVADAATQARQRRPTSTGRSSQETCVAALKAIFSRAHAAEHTPPGSSPTTPAAALRKPRRSRSRRRALDDRELAELIDAIRTTSKDPDLDLLLVRFHLEFGARREGALNLRLNDLDHRRTTVWLREKGGAEREQPVSPSLVHLLLRHAARREATRPQDPVFRTSPLRTDQRPPLQHHLRPRPQTRYAFHAWDAL